jgi:hypothetical protein
MPCQATDISSIASLSHRLKSVQYVRWGIRQVQVFGLSLRNPLDKNRNARQVLPMERYKLPLWVPLAILFAIGIAGFWAPNYIPAIALLAKNGVNEQWLGFAGAIAGALATIVAGGAALFAAYKTLRPVKDQLNQLVKQNDHMLYDRLRKRSVDLNAETILINQIVSGCEIVDRTLVTLLASSGPIPNGLSEFQTGVDRLEQFVARLQERRGDIWGDVATQDVREHFIDASLRGGSTAMRMAQTARTTGRLIRVLIKPEIKEWNDNRDIIATLGVRLALLIKFEFSNVRKETAVVESRLLGRKGVLS